jgi:hypothetical protein
VSKCKRNNGTIVPVMQVKQGHAGGVSKLKIKRGVNLSVIYRTLARLCGQV